MTVFRLEQFPNVCRVCLQHPREDLLVPTDEYIQQYSVKLIDFIDELTDPIPPELQYITPSGVCLSCYAELNAFLSYRKRLNLVVKFISSLAYVAKGHTGELEELVSLHRADLLAVLQELNILEKDDLNVQDLLDEFDQYCIGGMVTDEMENTAQEHELHDGLPQDADAMVRLEMIAATSNHPEEYETRIEMLETQRTIVTTEIELLNQNELKYVSDRILDRNMFPERNDLIDHSIDIMMDDHCVDGEVFEITETSAEDVIEKQSEELADSLRNEPKEELQQCKKCKFWTLCSATFQLHIEKHQKEDRETGYCCKRCKLEFDSKRELAQHKRSTHRDHMCDICGTSFDNKFALQTHCKRHEKVRQHKCEYCPQAYYTKTEKALHVKQAHLKAFEVSCPECALPFQTKQMLIQHLKSHTNQRTHTCSVCGYGFKSHTHLNRHMKGVHQGVQYACEHCNISYRRKDKLRLHMEKIHNIQTYFVCDICLQSYNSAEQLETHKAHHRNPKELQCGVCLGAYLTRKEFDKHLCYTYRENYICCNRDFKFHCYYNKHMFLAHGEHTNVRVKPTDGLLMGQFRAMRRQEERCPKCGQEFATRNLKKHHLETCGLEQYEEQYIDQQHVDGFVVD